MYMILGKGRKSGVARATEATASLAPLTMTVECTNLNLKSAQTAQLGQPAPKLELDSFILRHSRAKLKTIL